MQISLPKIPKTVGLLFDNLDACANSNRERKGPHGALETRCPASQVNRLDAAESEDRLHAQLSVLEFRASCSCLQHETSTTNVVRE